MALYSVREKLLAPLTPAPLTTLMPLMSPVPLGSLLGSATSKDAMFAGLTRKLFESVSLEM